VHEDAAHGDRQVAFAFGVADLKALVVLQDVPAAQLIGAGVLLVLVASGDVVDLGGPGQVAGGQLGGLDVELGGGARNVQPALPIAATLS